MAAGNGGIMGVMIMSSALKPAGAAKARINERNENISMKAAINGDNISARKWRNERNIISQHRAWRCDAARHACFAGASDAQRAGYRKQHFGAATFGVRRHGGSNAHRASRRRLIGRT
jgi:hypothetical protein